MTSDIAGFKLRFAERSHQPEFAQRAPLLQGAIVSTNVAPDTSIILGERGRKYFEPRYSAAEQPVMKKSTQPKESEEEVKRGKRCVAAPKSSGIELSHNERVHYPEQVGGQETGSGGHGRRKSNLQVTVPKTQNIEQTMNRKQRVEGESARRNDIGVATAGDKPYREADREPDFYAK